MHPAPVLTGPEAEYQRAAGLARSGNYKEAMTVYRKIVAGPATVVSADAEFEIAALYTYYNNPQRDYVQALAGFEEFIRRYPEHAKVREARTWQSLLRQVIETNRENERLKKNIEQLKNLDIMHEERRRK